MKKNYLEIARVLYKPTPKVEALAVKLCGLFDKPLLNGVVINELRFDKNHLKVGDLIVKTVERVDNHCGIEIHWYPDFKISTKRDPFCSIFMLKYNELLKIYREVEKVLATMQAK